MPNIRIDEQVYEALQKQATAFVDTPNSVLRRLLHLDEEDISGASTGRGQLHDVVITRPDRRGEARRRGATRRIRKRTARATAGSLLPQNAYVEPLLAVLAERGGAAPAREVIDAVGRRLNGKITAIDQEQLPSGGIRWMNRVQFVRLQLVEEGLLARDAPRGVWTLTEAGRVRVDRHG